MFGIALITACVALLAQHTGLTEAIAKEALKAAKCPKCSVMWITLAMLIYLGCDILTAIALSLSCAYLSYWLGLLLIWFNSIHTKIWQRLSERQ